MIKKPLSDDLNDLKKGFESKKEIRPDDSRVVIAEMQINAIKELSKDDNQVFSQLSSSEVFDVSRAYVFSSNPLPSVSKRLEEKGIEFSFSLPVLEKFLDENIKHRHKIDRQRVGEYIKGLEAVSPKSNNIFSQDPEKRSMMQRLI